MNINYLVIVCINFESKLDFKKESKTDATNEAKLEAKLGDKHVIER